jgi:hypothetical protein
LSKPSLRQRRARQPDALPYGEVWCVFDREAAHEPADFPVAIIRADRFPNPSTLVQRLVRRLIEE